VIAAARAAAYHPAVALLTAFPLGDDEWQEMGADKMLVKPMQTVALLRQIEKLLATHSAKLARLSSAASGAKKAKKSVAKKLPAKKVVVKKPVRRKKR
jgi:DNA-binding response OmpR family regulator